ncbi:unnamed protein product [Gemmata massiliana]|uniref:Uncharacterized protein n=2 Tax=Gemmata massiliana TaxID=1210884 RepID=A0A6P2D1H0_9BACT|nr:unnamed protein product [Gemmata massiliana]
MGVHTELLGRQVRCPHCKRVVIAPAAAGTPSAPPPPEPEIRPFNIPQKEGADSILSESDESDDEVFISPANTPTRPILFPSPQQSSEPESDPAPEPGATASAGLKLFPESSDSLPDPAPQTLVTGPEPGRHASAFSAPPVPEPKPEPPSPLTSLNPDPEREDTLPPPSDSPRPDEANPFTGFEPDPLPLPFVKAPKAPELPAPSAAPSEPAPSKKSLLDEAPTDREEKPARAERSRPTPVAASSRAKSTVLVLLAGYALVVTMLAVYGLFFKSRGVPETGHPLSTIPDTFGEFDPVSRKKVTKLDFPVDGELPTAQRAQLGGKITIGQLEVEPVRVQKRPLQMILEGTDEKDKQTLRAGTALVMTIAIKNLSSDTPIYPMDPAFLRRASKDDQPITRLVIGHKVFAGGEIEWPLPGRFKKKIEVQQGNDAKILEPRHSQEYIVFTEANPDLIKAAESTREALQWRVQVRRGLIDYKGKEVPVTAVIGVDFKASDIRGMD